MSEEVEERRWYCGCSWKGTECGVMSEDEWRETPPGDFRPNTKWVLLTEEEMVGTDWERYIPRKKGGKR